MQQSLIAKRMPSCAAVNRAPPRRRTGAIANADVDLWIGDLKIESARVHGYERLLSEDELSRAWRFKFSLDRDFFITARGWLRQMLSRYTRTNPREIVFLYNASGRPRLAPPYSPIVFNLSHTGGIAALAVSNYVELGIDIEQRDSSVNVFEIARQFFSPAEVRKIEVLRDAEQAVAFYKVWTQKEAFVKAVGDGLALPLDQFSVAANTGEKAALLEVNWDPAEASRWQMHEFSPAPNCSGALAVRGKIRNLRFRS